MQMPNDAEKRFVEEVTYQMQYELVDHMYVLIVKDLGCEMDHFEERVKAYDKKFDKHRRLNWKCFRPCGDTMYLTTDNGCLRWDVLNYVDNFIQTLPHSKPFFYLSEACAAQEFSLQK